MEVAGGVVGGTTTSAIIHLELGLGYLVHFKRNVNNLTNKIQQLSAAADDLHSLINIVLNNNELIRETVQAWLRRAETVRGEAMQLIDEAGYINNWFRGWCCSRFSLGRQAEKQNTVIQGLLDERSTIGDNVSIPKPSQSLELMSAVDFNVFSSRESTAKRVIESLSNENISLVGIFGMPGVGKTMLIQAIAKQVKEERLFQEVVMVVVSQNHVLERMQGDVAMGLDLDLHEEDNPFTRAARLSERLNRGKTILVVLDDLWERVDLAKAGICLRNNNNGCKVVFTTRDKSMCNQMEADESIEVAVLLEDDSWTLFHQKAGDVVEFAISPSISREIVKECEGLPLAIVTLGLALRNIDDELIWKDTLTQLKKSIFEGMTPVVSSLRLSYDFLRNEMIKLCFLFCCLFPEDYKIKFDVLLRYLIGENLIKDVDNLEESRGRLQSLVGKLISSNLLLKDEQGYIMMHDVVRDVAISIASEEDRLGFIVKAGFGLNHWPILELSSCKRMSVMKNEIRYELPRQINAPNLTTLSMRNNEHLKEIPNVFFNEMGSLLTLDLSRTGITSLPSSLSHLSNLRTLLSERCRLNCLSPVEKLERLEILSVRRSVIQRNPEDTANWKSIKLLDLSDSQWSAGFPPNLIGNMFNLEELYMPSAGWVVEDSEEVFSHIQSLTRLNALELPKLIPSLLSRDIPNWETLTRFRFCISNEIHNLLDSRGSDFHRIILLEISSNFVLANWVKMLVAKTEALLLLNCQGIESVIELDATGLNDLKFLRFQGSTTMKYLINTMTEMAPRYVFSSLKELSIVKMDNFESFCLGMLPVGYLCKLRILKMLNCWGVISLFQDDLLMRLQNLEDLLVQDCTRLEKLIQSEELEGLAANFLSNKSSTSKISNCAPSVPFPNLRLLNISGCPQLEFVFSLRVAWGLLQLTKLTVVNCTSIKTIFANDTGEDTSDAKKDKLILPMLKRLKFSRLGKLSTLSPPGLSIHCPSLEYMEVEICQNLKRLPFGSEGVPKLKWLNVDPNWFDELEWEDEGAKPCLQRFM